MAAEIETSSDVQWKRSLRIRIYENQAHRDGPRQIWAGVSKSKDDIIIQVEDKQYVFSPETIEAIYDMHQDIPR